MAYRVIDRVKEVSYTQGTGPIAFNEGIPGYQRHADVLDDGDMAPMCVANDAGEWETFLGQWNATTQTMSRVATIESSNGGAAVNLSGGPRQFAWINYSAARSNASIVNVREFGAVGDGVTDDTAAIQRAAAAIPTSGGILYLPTGTYLVSSTIFLKSNTWARGDGPATVLYAVRGANWVTNVDDLTGINTWTNGNVRVLIANENYDASDYSDENITISDLQLDLDEAGSAQRKAGIWMVSATNIEVRNVTTIGGGGVVAFLHTRQTLISDCRFYDFHSSGADHYSGFRDAKVINSYFRQEAISSSNPLIQATGTNNNNTDNTSEGFICIGNTVVATGSFLQNVGAISITAAGSGGTVNNAIIAHNEVDCGSLGAGGIICYGSGDNWSVTNNTIRNVDDYTVINCFGNGFTAPTRVRVDGNRLIDCTRTSGGATLMAVTAAGSSLTNNDALDCTCTTIAALDSSGGVLSLGSIEGTSYTNPFTLANGAHFQGQVAGSWTPSLTFGGATTGITYSTQTGTYVRLGDMVYVEVAIVLTSKGSASGSAQMTGIPFNDATGTVPSRFHIRALANMNSITEDPLIRVSDNVITMAANARGGAALDDTNFANNTNLTFCGWYRAS